ncbi:MAG: hypothetical protein AB1646_21230 [Thermodesulfobacteriota bacterium]
MRLLEIVKDRFGLPVSAPPAVNGEHVQVEVTATARIVESAATVSPDPRSPQPAPETDPVLPDFCDWSCPARLADGCFVRGDRWTPFDRMPDCIKFRVWGCEMCEHFYEGWCAFESGPTCRNLTTMGTRPKGPPKPEPEEPLWDYDTFPRERGCYGCGHFEPFVGSYRCHCDGRCSTIDLVNMAEIFCKGGE